MSRELTLPVENRSKDKIESLEENINIIEKGLARKGRSLEETQKEIGFQELIHSLKPNEAVIEFVHFNFIKAEFTDSIIYAALLIRKDFLEPVYIKLFEQKSLDSLLKFENSRYRISHANMFHRSAHSHLESRSLATRLSSISL